MSNLEAKLDALIDVLGYDIETIYHYNSYDQAKHGNQPTIEYKLTKREKASALGEWTPDFDLEEGVTYPFPNGNFKYTNGELVEQNDE